MFNLKTCYAMPQIIYIDINTDVKEDKYLEWKETMFKQGWSIKESEVWTRKGLGARQVDTNIDIVAYREIDHYEINLKVGEYNHWTSDHKPLIIEVSKKEMRKNKHIEKEKVLNKGWLKKTTKMMM